MPRATPLLDLRDALVTLFEGLTPPTDSTAKYVHADKPGDGASAHRQFWFRPSKGSGVTEQGKGRFMLRHNFEAVMMIHVPERTSVEFNAVYEEAMTLISAVNTMSLPTSVNLCRATGYFPEELIAGDEADLSLVITIEAATKEANP